VSEENTAFLDLVAHALALRVMKHFVEIVSFRSITGSVGLVPVGATIASYQTASSKKLLFRTKHCSPGKARRTVFCAEEKYGADCSQSIVIPTGTSPTEMLFRVRPEPETTHRFC
jgi:hypothetical protein